MNPNLTLSLALNPLLNLTLDPNLSLVGGRPLKDD
jgi:hypothetical protein